MNEIIMKLRFIIAFIQLCCCTTLFAQSTITVKHPTAPVNTVLPGANTYDYQGYQEIILDPGFYYEPSGTNNLNAWINNKLYTPDITYAGGGQPVGRTNLNTALKVGTLEGITDVNPLGQTSYTIPVFAAPGTAGMVPDLAIRYMSHGDQGMLGYKWDLTGLATISRGNADLYLDGVRDGSSFFTSDKFSLDGERLIPIVGNNGVDGTTYGTEKESFTQIISKGFVGSGPEWFQVKDQDGTVMEIGRTVDSRMSNAAGTVIIWKVNKITDVNGNYIRFTYRNDGDEMVIDQIEYTGNVAAGLQPYNKIDFYYAKRSDPQEKYVNGKRILNSLVISSIVSSAEGKKVRQLDFRYSIDLYTKLVEITEKDGEGNSKNPTLVEWEAPIFNVVDMPGAYGIDINIRMFAKGDLNGDGYPDYVAGHFVNGNDDHFIRMIITDRNTGGNQHIVLPTGRFDGTLQKKPSVSVFDFDKNGRDEVYVRMLDSYNSTTRTHYYRFDGYEYNPATNAVVQITNTITQQSIGGNAGNTRDQDLTLLIPADVNGDGNYEAFFYNRNNQAHGLITSMFSLQTPAINQSVSFGSGSVTTDQQAIDFNGDGNTEFAVRHDQYIYINKFNVSTNSWNTAYTNSTAIDADDKIWWADFNGDGNTDLLAFDPVAKTYKVFVSNGQALIEKPGMAGQLNAYYAIAYHDHMLELGDMNNDGKTDLLYLPVNINLPVRAFLSDGIVLHNITYLSGMDYSSFGVFTDATGDGMPDYFTGASLKKITIGKTGGNVVAAIVNGMNVRKEYTFGFVRNNLTSYAHDVTGLSFASKVQYVSQMITTKVETKDHRTGSLLSTMIYGYKNAVIDPEVKGFAGFLEFTKLYIKNSKQRSLTATVSTYNTAYGILIPQQIRTYTNQNLVSTMNVTYGITNKGGKRYWQYLTSQEETDHLNSIIATSSGFQYESTSGEVSQYTNANGYSSSTVTRTFENVNSYCNNKISTEQVATTIAGNTKTVQTTYDYDALGNLQSEVTAPYPIQPKVPTTTYGYNQLGLLTQKTITSPGLPTVTEQYDYDYYKRFVVKAYNPLGQLTERMFDAGTGQVTFERGVDDLTKSFVYDTWGDLLQAKDEFGIIATQSKTWRNPNAGTEDYYAISVQKDGTPGNTTVYSLLGDKELEITKNLTGQDVYSDYGYDGDGLLSYKTYPYFSGGAVNRINYTYDNYDRLATATDVIKGQTITYTYGTRTVRALETGTSGTISDVTREVNQDGKIKTVTDLAGVINYTYDAFSNLKTIVGPSGTITMEYDVYGRQNKLIDPSSGTSEYEYNAYGQLKYQKDANGNEFTINYDNAGRVTLKTDVTNSKQSTYTYVTSGNGLNRIASVTDYDGVTVSYTYNALHLPVAVNENIGGQNFGTAYAYSSYGDVASVVYPSGYTVSRKYNTVGAAYEIKDETNNRVLWTQGTVNAFNAPEQEILANNYKLNTTYDKYRPQQVNLANPSGSANIFNRTYVFDAASGNLKSRKKQLNVSQYLLEEFTYDHMNRLTETKLNGTVQLTMNFEANGNIQNKSDVSANNYQYTVGPNNVTAIPNPTTAIPSFTQNITYNSLLLPVSISENNKILTILYGPDGARKRTRLQVSGVQTLERFYVGDYEKEITSTATKEFHYVYSPNGLLGVNIKQNGTNQFYYTYTDYLGSILGLMDVNGNVIEEFDVDAWGRRRNPTNWTYTSVPAATIINRCYTGHEHLDEFKLINMNARLYDPVLGRMLSPDKFIQAPEFTQNLNRYSYAFNNPLKYTDPTGNTIVGGGVTLPSANDGVNQSNRFYSVGESDYGRLDELSELESLMQQSIKGGANDGESEGEESNGDPENPKPPEGVVKIKTVEDAVKNGAPMPNAYFINNSNEMAYVKLENSDKVVPVGPGEMFLYRIDGAATKSNGVYKVPDLGSVYVDRMGIIKETGMIMKLHDLIDSDRGNKDSNWLNDLQRANDHGWDNLFNSIR